jgi:hypothetical protein
MGIFEAIGGLVGSLFGAGGFLSGITSVLGAVTGVMSIVNALNPPKINLPSIQIPQTMMDSLNSNIQNNQQLTDTARQAAQQALSDYNSGKLSPQYQALLDNWYSKQKTQLLQQFQGEGQGNSTELTSALNNLDQQYQAQAANYMQTQLTNALNLAGIPQSQIANITSSINTSLGAQSANNQAILGSYGISNNVAANTGNALASTGKVLGDLGGSITSNSTSTSSNPSTSSTNNSTDWWSYPDLEN